MERRPLDLAAARQAARDNLVTTYLGLAAGAPGCRITADALMVSCECHPDVSFGNFSLRFSGDDESLSRIVTRCVDAAEASPQYRVLVTTEDRPRGLGASLRQHGFEMAGRLTVMAAEGFPEAYRAQVDMTRLTAMPDRRRLADFMIRHFSSRREPYQREILTESTAASPHALWSVGVRELVAGVMLSESAGALGLYNLCVAPRHQSQGLGSALVRACGALATLDHRLLVLQSAPALVPWYRRLGFQEIGYLETYRPTFA